MPPPHSHQCPAGLRRGPAGLQCSSRAQAPRPQASTLYAVASYARMYVLTGWHCYTLPMRPLQGLQLGGSLLTRCSTPPSLLPELAGSSLWGSAGLGIILTEASSMDVTPLICTHKSIRPSLGHCSSVWVVPRVLYSFHPTVHSTNGY